MKVYALALALLLGMATSAVALKWNSDRTKVDQALQAVTMADGLAAGGDPDSITVRVNQPNAPLDPNTGQQIQPTVVLTPGSPGYATLLTNVTNKLNNDKAQAQAYLASVGVTND